MPSERYDNAFRASTSDINDKVKRLLKLARTHDDLLPCEIDVRIIVNRHTQPGNPPLDEHLLGPDGQLHWLRSGPLGTGVFASALNVRDHEGSLVWEIDLAYDGKPGGRRILEQWPKPISKFTPDQVRALLDRELSHAEETARKVEI